mmetsp:Transcript_11830/g.35243  ORF Transcript_11830/g.35243 Transcript_11830/m.35243 type:complete len:482 (-) Transcript_11830:26-1471(-)
MKILGEELGHNVVLNLITAMLMGFSESIWTGTIGVTYVYDVWKTNTKVGIQTTMQGLASIIVAFPAGWAADKFPRSRVIKVGAAAILVGAPLYALSVVDAAEGNHLQLNFYLICAATALFGISSGIANGPAQALLADSIETGTRSRVYNWLFLCYIVPSTLGPAITCLYFGVAGDAWRLPALRDLILVGLVLEIPVGFLCCMFRDDKALGAASDAVQDQRVSSATADEGGDVSLRPKEVDVEGFGDGGEAGEGPGEASEGEDAAAAAAEADPRVRRVPYLVFCSDLTIALGSGMTVKYFPLFFKEDLHMSPAAVQAIYVAVPLAMALASVVGTALGRRIGRVHAVLLLRAVGLSSFAGMLALFHMKAPKFIIVGLYVLRTAAMNATYPLEESILMDYVPKATRARWKSMESVSMFGWCGSALVGGVLADLYGYAFTFAITIALQSTAVLVYSNLLGVVKREKLKPADLHTDLGEPLLDDTD